MSRISFYVLTQLLVTFVVTLVGMTFVMVFGIMAKEGMRQGLGASAILRLLPFATPSALRFAAPASVLLATCSVFGRMSADNEIVAAKSLGITPRVMLHPAFILAAALSISMIWLNDVAVTWGADGMQTVIAESVEDVVFRLLKTERSFKNKTFEINVKDVQDRTLIDARLVYLADHKVVIEAREAKLRTDLEGQKLVISVTDYIWETPHMRGADHSTFDCVIPLSLATKKERHELRPSELGLSKISDEAIAQQSFISDIESQLAARAAFQMVMGDIPQLAAHAPHPDNQTWESLHDEYSTARRRLHRLKLEPWRRYAEGFSCLFIVMVGAPLAIKMRTSNFFTTFAMCFFPVLCGYYPLLQWAVDQAKDGDLPPYTVWIGNAALLLVGSWFTRRIVRY